jgi:bacterioferritin-associated ferredoxin
MYLCICCDITEKDVKENPKLRRYIGSVCGACISDGADTGFDVVDEILVDNSPDHDTIE